MKTVLITGANRGLGLGFVKHFLSVGYLVFACVRNLESFPNDIAKNNNVELIKMDITSDESIISALKTVKKNTEKLDILVNNAGVSKDTVGKEKSLVNSIIHLDRENMLKMFDINSVSPFILIKHLLPLLSNSSNAYIINISSARASFKDEWDLLGYNYPNYGYRGSKSALSIMTHALIKELPKSIKAFSVDPGDVRTEMNTDGEQDPQQTAQLIMNIADNWKEEYNGEFMKYTGEPYPK